MVAFTNLSLLRSTFSSFEARGCYIFGGLQAIGMRSSLSHALPWPLMVMPINDEWWTVGTKAPYWELYTVWLRTMHPWGLIGTREASVTNTTNWIGWLCRGPMVTIYRVHERYKRKPLDLEITLILLTIILHLLTNAMSLHLESYYYAIV
jgi:hypothetical protein